MRKSASSPAKHRPPRRAGDPLVVRPVDADTADGATTRPRREKSLLARALSYLARREHSRTELARKLTRYAPNPAEVDLVLDQLQSQRLLSDARFAGMVARTRGARFGMARVRYELKTHGLEDTLVRETVAELRASELSRARALWSRRFGTPAADAAERLRQMRFLAGRGFALDVIRKVVGGRDED